MKHDFLNMIKVRAISVGFTVLALAIFKPFGLEAWQWEAYVHLFDIGLLGVLVCLVTEAILKYLVRIPMSTEQGVDYIIRRNLWFQLINTPLVSFMICLYRHFLLSDRVEGNHLSWSNFFETLVIIAFCSFAIGLYWRFKYRSKYLASELEEIRQMNDELQRMRVEMQAHIQEPGLVAAEESESQANEESEKAFGVATATKQPPAEITITGTTSEKVTLSVMNLLYVEAVGNYVKIYQLKDGKVRTDTVRVTLRQVENELSIYPMVVRCHRAFIVNLQQVEQVVSRSGNVQLLIRHCQEYLPVSRSHISHVKEAIKGDEMV